MITLRKIEVAPDCHCDNVIYVHITKNYLISVEVWILTVKPHKDIIVHTNRRVYLDNMHNENARLSQKREENLQVRVMSVIFSKRVILITLNPK